MPYPCSPFYADNVGTQKDDGKQKPRKSRLLSYIKWEENRIELQTTVNGKPQKSKPRKSRNACTANMA